MRMPHSLTVATVIATLVAQSAVSQEQPHYYFDCDAPEARFSAWTRTIAAPLPMISGKVALINSRDHSRWLSSATVYFKSKDEARSVGVALYILKDSPNMLQVDVRQWRKGAEPEGRNLGAVARSSEPMAFSIQLSSANELAVQVASFAIRGPIKDFVAASVSLSCSTGEFKFYDISVDERSS
jgi:hypothetical protein